MRSSFDVVIVGNGIIGHATAQALLRQDPSTKVAVVGPSDRAGGASPAAGAMLGLYGEVTKYTAASEASRTKWDFMRRASSCWPDFVAGLAEAGPGPAPRITLGTHVVLNGRSGWLDSENFTAMVSMLQAHGEAFEEDVAVPGLNPTPTARPLRSVYVANEGSVDARLVLDRLVAANEALGGEVVDSIVESVDLIGGRAHGVFLRDGSSLRAGHVVIATGASSARLLEAALGPGVVQPVLAGSGVAFAAERAMGDGFEQVVRTINRAGSCGLHVVPLGGGLEYLGATNVLFREPELTPHVGVVHFLADCAMDQLDTKLAYSRIGQLWIGNRPVPLDTLPMCGPTPVPGLVVLTGMYRDGFHAAPLVAELAASAIYSGESTFPQAFDPFRTPHCVFSVEDSINEFAHQAVSSAFENGTRLSTFMSADDLDGMYRDQARAFFQSTGLHRGLAPDVLSFLLLSRKSDADVGIVVEYLAGKGWR